MGLERTSFNVSETVGVVEVCAIVYSPTIDCPFNFPFDVSLSTSDNTAGMFFSVVHFFVWIVYVQMFNSNNYLSHLQRNPWTTFNSQGS